jgi:predicted RNase H-like HicB family nuclease
VQYTAIIENADDGSFSVWVPDLPGCVSTGDTRQEALEMIQEAIRGHIETLKSLGEPVPPARSSATIVTAA